MYVALIEQQMGTEKYSIALRLLKEAVKKFPSDHKVKNSRLFEILTCNSALGANGPLSNEPE